MESGKSETKKIIIILNIDHRPQLMRFKRSECLATTLGAIAKKFRSNSDWTANIWEKIACT